MHAARTLLTVCLLLGLTGGAEAAQKKKHPSHHPKHPAAAATDKAAEPAPETEAEPEASPAPATTETKEEAPAVQEKAAPRKAAASKKGLDFDFFGGEGEGGGEGGAGAGNGASAEEIEAQGRTRRWMLKTHQVLGITTWALLVGTVVVGQLNYNQLYAGGGGSQKWQTPHRYLVLSTSVAFAGTGAFAIFAPNPYDRPLHFDTGLIHRIAVIGATLGMVTEGVLGWVTTHQADAGNPNNLRSMARLHQIVGYSTLGFLTVAGAVWIF
jgi:hypothetical protein